MIKVAILALARQRNGGTLPYTRSMVEALRRLPPHDFRLTLYTAFDNHEYDDLGVPLVRLPSSLALVAARLAGRDPFEDHDAVIAPIYSTILLATRRPFAFTLHDLQEKHFPEYFTFATRVWRHVTNRLLTARAAVIVCESNFVQNDIVTYFGVPSSRIEVVPAPPVSALRDVDVDADQAAATRKKFNLSSQFVFYPAQFWPHKNHLRLVEAFARVARTHPECELVLTGQERDEYARVFARVRALGLTARVRHIGYVDRHDLAALYACATLVAVPTLFESISIPIYEAFSIGTAVCASNVVALPEQVGDAGLLFDPLSIEDLAAKMESLLADPPLRQRLIERGFHRISSVTPDIYAARLARVIGTLVAQRSAGRQ